MIKAINNNINFGRAITKSELRKIRQSDYAGAKKDYPQIDYSKIPTRKVSPLQAGAALAAALLLVTGGAMRTNSKDEKNIELGQSPSVIIVNAQTDCEENETKPQKISVKEAVQTIQSSEKLSKVYGDMIDTIQNMEKTIDNPIGTIQNILEKPYAQGIELELVLPQIFVESSGCHYDENGDVLKSYANCNGWMQLSEDATSDMNRLIFEDNNKNRNMPKDNLHLGISFDSHLLERFDGDMFKTLAAYNCGATNVRNGKTYGDEYAQEILEYYKVLKNNPQFTKMLISGQLDEYKNDFLYS